MKVRVGFGLGVTAGSGLDADAFWEIVDTAEALRWDSIWLSERLSGDLVDPVAAMAAIAGRTQKLKFGPSVLVLPGRNPVVLAKELATIDVLSRGRLVVAFGLGSDFPSEHGAFGVKRSDRASMTDEGAELIVRLWTSEHVTHHGRHFHVEDLTLLPKPVKKPFPDVWFGGHSEAAARRVGRLGTGWLPSFVAPSEYGGRVELIKRVAAEHGREIEDDHYGALVPYLPTPDGADRVMGAIASRRPGVDARDIVAPDGDAGLRTLLERFVEAGATKFAVVPVTPPAHWPSELERLRAKVAEPLED